MDDPLSSLAFWERNEPSPMERDAPTSGNSLLADDYSQHNGTQELSDLESNRVSSQQASRSTSTNTNATSKNSPTNPFMENHQSVSNGVSQSNRNETTSPFYSPLTDGRNHAAENVSEEDSHMNLLLRNDREREGKRQYWQTTDWEAVSNLDVFFEQLYNYYNESGFASIVFRRVMNLITLGFTLLLSTFLIGYVQWSEIIKCTDVDTCKENFSDYISSFNDPSNSLAKRWFVVLYIIIGSGYWVWSCVTLVPTLQSMWQIKKFYETRLKLGTRELQTMEWSAVVDKLIQLQNSRQFRFQVNCAITAQNIAMRIMRRDNLLIALVNHNVLPIGSKQLGQALIHGKSLDLGTNWFFGKVIEFGLRMIIFKNLFNENFVIRPAFFQNPDLLRLRFKQYGILCLVTLPFSLGFLIVFYFLKYAEQFHSKKIYLGPRDWSRYARWQFREINELPHIFERRISASLTHAEDFVKQFPSPVPSIVASGISFVAGGVLGILLVFTFIDESILLHVKLRGRNLLWYVAIFSAVLAMARAMVPLDESIIFNPNAIMRKVVAFTHHLPDKWRLKCHTYDVRDAFCELFQYKIVLIVQEIVSLLTAPFVFYWVLPQYSNDIIDYFRRYTVHVEGMGQVCVFSQFDLSAHGDPRYGTSEPEAQNDPSRQLPQGESQRPRDRGGQVLRMNGGKLEKSWLNFHSNYNITDTDSDGQQLLDRLTQFQQDTVQSVVESDLMGTHQGSVSLDMTGSMMLNSTPSTIARLASTGERSAPASSQVVRDARDPNDRQYQRYDMTQSQMPATSPVQREPVHPMSQSIPTIQQGFFDNQASVTAPLRSMNFQNAENYFYWLEEYRDANSKKPAMS